MNLENHLTDFSLENPRLLAETPRATLWHVDAQSGPAVLKVFSARGLKSGDKTGTRLLQLWGGDGAVRVIEESEDAVLMERLSGPTLAQSTPRGKDEEAARVIASVSLKLQRPPKGGYIHLKDHFGGALLTAEINKFPEPLQPSFVRAKALFKWLVASTDGPRLMHGDLNYDNIIQSDRGWLAIDPKGIIADPCYEFGVVFRNPTSEPERIATPERIMNLAGQLAAVTNFDAQRILQFGFVHVAMSLAYHFDRTSSFSEPDLAIFKSFDGLRLSPPFE